MLAVIKKVNRAYKLFCNFSKFQKYAFALNVVSEQQHYKEIVVIDPQAYSVVCPHPTVAELSTSSPPIISR